MSSSDNGILLSFQQVGKNASYTDFFTVSAAGEQISVSQGVAKHIAGIADIAHDTERASRESASNSDVLAELAAKQQALIARFTV